MGNLFNSKELLMGGINKLKSKKISTAEVDARVLLSYAINCQNTVYIHNDIPISKLEKKKFFDCLEKRIQGEPVSRIVGKRNFWKNNFLINNYTLDPRPDTEVIIDVVTKNYCNNINHIQILDLGSGSGCIGLSILEDLKNASLLSLDICKQALNQVNINAKRLNLSKKLFCSQINWFENTWIERINLITQKETLFLKKKFDIIVSNPPYIKSSDIAKLQNEVKNYDPLISLDGGIDGCDSYRAIFRGLRQLLTIDGVGFFEIGFDMLDDIKIILKEFNLNLIRVHKDIQGHNRVIEIK